MPTGRASTRSPRAWRVDVGPPATPEGSGTRREPRSRTSRAGLYCAMGIMAALLERETSGEGQWVDSSLLAAQSRGDGLSGRAVDGRPRGRAAGRQRPPALHATGMFETRDGFLTSRRRGTRCSLGSVWRSASKSCSRTRASPTGDARGKNRAELNEAIADVTRTATTAEWVERLEPPQRALGSGLHFRPDLRGSAGRHIGMAAPVDHPTRGRIELVGQPVRFHRTPWRMRNACPEMGEHTDAILTGLGYSEEEIQALRKRDVL